MISNIGEGATPLMYACQQSREREVVDLIARKRNSVRERDRTLKTALHYCTENATIGCAEAVLRAAPELLDAKDEDGYTALHLAVIAGNKTFLRFLISRGANVNALDNEKHSAVHWATVCGEEEALEIVLRAGAKVSTADIHGGYPLHYAAQMCGPGGEMGRDPKIGLRILNILLSHDVDINVKDKDGRQPILWAASAGSADAILSLVKAGASVEASDKDGLTALHCAASRGHTDCIETLITLCGANIDVIDSNGCTSLFYAVTLGHADASQLLLSLGAEPNRQDRKGRTPAHCGAAKGQLETLRILLNYGANLWLRNVKGDFPLHEAIASGRRDLVRWLLNQRPDSINVGNNDGRCPIHIAAINNNIDMIKILLDAQSLVNPIMRTTKGVLMTPLDAALHRGFRGCAKYLQLHGGVPFTKLTEKSSNVKGISSRQITTDMYIDNYNDRVGMSNWGVSQTLTAPLSGFIPTQIRMGGDNAIQQIQTSDLRTVTQIHDAYEDLRSSDEERVYRRRRRRKKWEHQKKGYISEEDSNLEDQVQEMEYRRRQRADAEESRQKKREQVDESSSDNELYKKKAMKKKDSSDSDNRKSGRRVQHQDKAKYYSASDDSDKEERFRKRKSRKESLQQVGAKSEHAIREKIPENVSFTRLGSGTETEVVQSVVAEVHEQPVADDDPDPGVTATALNEEKDVEKPEQETHEETLNSEQVEVISAAEVLDEKADEDQDAGSTIAVEVQEPVIEAQQIGNLEAEVEQEVIVKSADAETENPTEKEGDDEVGNDAQKTETEDGNEAALENANANEPETTEKTAEEVVEAAPMEEVQESTAPEPVIEEETVAVEETTQEVEKEPAEVVEDVSEATDKDMEVEKTEGKDEDVSEVIADEAEYREEDVNEAVESEGEEETKEDDIEEEEEEEEEEEVEPEDNVENERNEFVDNAFEVLDSSAVSGTYREENHTRPEESSSRRGSDSGAKEYRSGDADGSNGDESGGSTRNEDSSALMDSGIEPSPRRKSKSSERGGNSGSVRSRVPRLCNKGKPPEEVHTVSVTQTVQNTIRKYHMERRIFYQLLELKRLQIRAGRANEQVLVKRLVDEYRRGGIIPGLQNYTGQYTFRQFENFLYDQLRTLQSTAHILIPKLRPSDDIETLSSILRKSRVELVDDIPDNPMFCTQGTHRCHHAAHAYTGIPCAAYITKFNHHEMPKPRSTGFLPQIEQTYLDRQAEQQTTYRPVTLEVSHGKEKQVISLPTDRLDKNKRYYVTFTIKGGAPLDEAKTPGHEERMLRHRHAKSF